MLLFQRYTVCVVLALLDLLRTVTSIREAAPDARPVMVKSAVAYLGAPAVRLLITKYLLSFEARLAVLPEE